MHLHRGIWLLLPWLIPMLAYAKPPKATAPVLVPINTQFLGSDGQTYTLTGTLSLQGGTVTPPPPPDVKMAYAMISPSPVTAGQSSVFTVVMSRVVLQDVQVPVTCNDPGVQVPTLVTVPAGRDLGTVTVLTLRGATASRVVPISAKYGTSGYASLTILPDGVTPPPVPGAGTPLVSAYVNTDGSPVVSPSYGQEIKIRGSGFGATAGKVTWNGGLVPVVSWSEAEIRVKLPYPALPVGGHEFTVVRPDGAAYDGMIPTDGPQRVPGSVRRR